MNNFHTHTYRCEHGNNHNDDEEIVLKAIELGFKNFGFSDHITISDFFDNGKGSKEVADDYYNSIMALKKKYQDQINIYFGYEAEYFPEYHQKYIQLLNQGQCQYLIFGNHYPFLDLKNYYGRGATLEQICHYHQQMIEGIKSGLFLYLAHPDLYIAGYQKWDEMTKVIAKSICYHAKKYNIPIELNLCGARKGNKKIIDVINNQELYDLGYPFKEFWKIAKEYGNWIVIGYDYHSVNDMENKNNQKIFDLIKELDLTIDYHFWELIDGKIVKKGKK